MKKILILFPLFLILGLTWQLRTSLFERILFHRAPHIKENFFATNPQESAKIHLSSFLKDAKSLEKVSFFSLGSAGPKDASHALNHLVSWPGHSGALSIPSDLKAKVKTGSNFLNNQIQWDNISLDFSWMKELHQFDHWNFDQKGPLYKTNGLYYRPQYLLPDFYEMVLWSRLRLLKALHNQSSLEALKEVRQLARLIYTTDTRIGALMSVEILKSETLFFEKLKDEDKPVDLWKPISMEILKVAKRFFVAQSAFLDLRISDEIFSKVYKLSPGRCIRMAEALSNQLTFRAFLKPKFQAAYDRMELAFQLTKISCRKGLIRNAWEYKKQNWIMGPKDELYRAGNALQSKPFYWPLSQSIKMEDLLKKPEMGLTLAYLFLSNRPSPFALYEE